MRNNVFITLLVITQFMVLFSSCVEKSKVIESHNISIQSRGDLSEVEVNTLNVVHEQLNAYNNRDVDAFVATYADDVKVYEFPDKLTYEGKEQLRASYADLFEWAVDLECTLLSEVVIGNKVIHEESIILIKGADVEPMHAVCVYVVEDGKIAEVYFL